MWGLPLDVIVKFEFRVDRSPNFGATGGRKSHFSYSRHIAYTTVLRYRVHCDGQQLVVVCCLLDSSHVDFTIKVIVYTVLSSHLKNYRYRQCNLNDAIVKWLYTIGLRFILLTLLCMEFGYTTCWRLMFYACSFYYSLCE